MNKYEKALVFLLEAAQKNYSKKQIQNTEDKKNICEAALTLKKLMKNYMLNEKEKKYYLELKEDVKLFLNEVNTLYLNFIIDEDKYILESCEEDYMYKTKFTKQEIENIKLPQGITLDMFNKKESLY